MNYKTDNRWSPGASGAEVPDDAPAAYSARWIDMGDLIPADVVPDRQGFGYNDTGYRDDLIDALKETDRRTPGSMPRDRSCIVVRSPLFTMVQRRAGGYIYVDAWLLP